MVSAIGAAEALDFGAPKKVDGEGGINLVNAARAAGVQHFIMVTSLGTGKLGWPAGARPQMPGLWKNRSMKESINECTSRGIAVEGAQMWRWGL